MQDKLQQVKQKEIKELKTALLKKQKFICPISLMVLEDNPKAVVDHQHKLYKSQTVGEEGAGLIRGVLDFRVNAFEGKVSRSFRRMGLHKLGLDLSAVLRNLADYLEEDPWPLIHPSEAPVPLKVSKRQFNLVYKRYTEENPKKKKLQYPKSKKATKLLKKLSEEYKISLFTEGQLKGKEKI